MVLHCIKLFIKTTPEQLLDMLQRFQCLVSKLVCIHNLTLHALILN